jgi:hypothetical protein
MDSLSVSGEEEDMKGLSKVYRVALALVGIGVLAAGATRRRRK